MPKSIRSDQIRSRIFKSHGKVEYDVRGKLLWAEAVGPFNRELMAAVLEMAIVTFPVMSAKGPWGHVCTFRESALCSPDVVADMAGAMDQMVQKGLAPGAMAFVLPPEVEGSLLMGPVFAKALKDVKVPFRHFAELDVALDWVRSVVGPLEESSDPGAKAAGSEADRG
jgi:hypothetical protein